MGVMIFAGKPKKHALSALESLPRLEGRMVTGENTKSRAETNSADFKARRFKYLVNIAVYNDWV